VAVANSETKWLGLTLKCGSSARISIPRMSLRGR